MKYNNFLNIESFMIRFILFIHEVVYIECSVATTNFIIMIRNDGVADDTFCAILCELRYLFNSIDCDKFLTNVFGNTSHTLYIQSLLKWHRAM